MPIIRITRTHIGMTGLIAADRAGLIAICVIDSSSLRRSPFPPVGRCPLGNYLRGEHDVGEVAELPQFVRGTAVLEDHLIGSERVQIAGAKAIQRFPYTPDKLLLFLREVLRGAPQASPLKPAGAISASSPPT